MEIGLPEAAGCLAGSVDGPVTGVVKTPGGKFNSSFYVSAGGAEYVLRIAPPDGEHCLFYEKRMMRRDPEIHARVLENTEAPVPGILAFDFSRTVIDRDFMVMEKLPGKPLSVGEHGDVDKILGSAGRALADVHGLISDEYGYRGENSPMEPACCWEDAFALMWSRLVDDAESTGHYSSSEAAFMKKLFDRHAGVFRGRSPASLLHMDVWSENILAEGSTLTGIIDWDRALWGDREMEYAVLDYCGISVPAFWEGYGTRREATAESQIRGRFYYLYELQKYIFIRHFRGGGPAAARPYRDACLSAARVLA